MNYLASNKKMVQLLIDYCCQYGVKHVIISPGSRNAPLIISFDNHPYFTCFTIPDERSAGFYGLGLARQLNQPVAIICTSGTAVLNYAPALAEAFYQKIPLIAITADRPPGLIDQEDGQTIRQPDVFFNILGKSVNLAANEKPESIRAAENDLQNAFHKATSWQKYPIHINVHLDEPLYETEWVTSNHAETLIASKNFSGLKSGQLANLYRAWSQCNKIMILCGVLLPDQLLNTLLNELGISKNIVIIAPPTANLWGDGIITPAEGVFLSISDDNAHLFKPELLITIGGPIVSKTIKQFFRNHKPQYHFDVDNHPEIINTYNCLTEKIDAPPLTVVDYLLNHGGTINNHYINQWKAQHELVHTKQRDFLEQIPWSDLWIYHSLFQVLNTPINLHLGNSTPVRYAEYFSKQVSISYFCNRGTSGIDGCTSTAAGSALATSEPTLLLSGDISFIYDCNSLWNIHIPKNLKILVINNNGGNIFNMVGDKLPKEQLNRHFITQQTGHIKYLCRAFDIAYLSLTDKHNFSKTITEFLTSPTCTVLEVFTANDESTIQWKSLVKHLKG